jgi:hypothetical protein
MEQLGDLAPLASALVWAAWAAPFALWVALAWLVAGLAARLGQHDGVAFLLALLLSPVIGAAIALLRGERPAAEAARIEREERLRAAARAKIAAEAAASSDTPRPGAPPPNGAGAGLRAER